MSWSEELMLSYPLWALAEILWERKKKTDAVLVGAVAVALLLGGLLDMWRGKR